MAATASSDHHQIHLHKKPLNFRRRRHHTTVVVSPENSSWCCPSTVSSNKPQPSSDSPALRPKPESFSDSPEYSDKSLILKQSPASLENSNMGTTYNHQETFPSSFSNFNSALTAGLLNPMSPPPSAADKARSSPTLFEMMANEPDCKTPNSNGNVSSYANPRKPNNNNNVNPSPGVNVIDRHALMQQRLLDLLSCRSPGSRFNEPNSSDVKLTLSSKDGLSVCMNAHRQILVSHSRFFAVKLSGWKGGQQGQPPYIVEISDCDDIEVYIESIRLMYCKDLRRKLMKEDVPRVLGILKVSAAIGFDAGVLSCLEYLEAAPWAEDEEEKVSSLLSELQLEGEGPIEVLKRVSVDFTSGVDESNNEVLLKLLHTVLEGKDEKARREMKVLVAKMLHENSSHNDLRKESLYSACDKCLILLKKHFLKASNGDLQDAAQIMRQADNLHFLLDILIDRQISEDFLKSWVSLTELSEVHSKVPPLHRYEISRVTARLFVGIGKGQLLASKDLRFLLLKTWLVPFYDDFAWMKRASRGLDRHLIEDGLGNTILTLPLTCQQEILMTWFDRFLNSSDDCPNIQRAFEVWWKRAFWKKGHQHPERPRQNESFRLS